MKLLLVSWSILPRAGGSSVIVEQLARNFDRQDMIVLGSSSLFGSRPPVRPADTPRFEYFHSEMSLFGRGERYFRWISKRRFPSLVNKIKELIRKEGIDYVIGVFPNDLYCYAACRAAKESGIPFSSYFHNTYVDNVAITDPKAAEIQQTIFDQSQYVFVMSRGMQRFYEEKYKLSNVVPLLHTFYDWPAEDTLSGIPGSKKSRYRLVAIGNFNESNMEATIRLADAVRDHPNYELNLYTHVPDLLLRKRGLNTTGIRHRGFVRPEEVHGVLQDYDIAVLTHGFTGGYGEVEYRTIFPTRTIPLLLSGKPILAHSPPGSFLNEFLEEHQCAELVAEAGQEAVLTGLERITASSDYQQQLVANAQRAARQFYGPEVVKQLTRLLQKKITQADEARL